MDRIIKGKLYKGKILKPKLTKTGYRSICLCKNGKQKYFRIHRLVAEAFLPNPENKPEVNHKIPVLQGGTDAIDNLNWSTRKENIEEENWKRTHKNPINIQPVMVYDLNGKYIGEFKSIKECEDKLKIKNVSYVINGKRKHSKNYIIKRKED